MGDKATLAQAKRELEELYLGVPDDSVNLTFGHLAEIQQRSITLENKSFKKEVIISEKKEGLQTNLSKLPSLDFSRAFEASTNQYYLEPISEGTPKREGSPVPLMKMPSLDFSKALEASRICYPQHDSPKDTVDSLRSHRGRPDHHDHNESPRMNIGFRNIVEMNSMPYEDKSSMGSMSTTSMSPFQEGRGRRRPGIPHTNICTICSSYIYIFRHRCLVCGRVYCKHCVSIGMGEMTEGRKCVECLGRKFSQRYIQRAGQMGCCMGYASIVKQQELKWAEKGPRRRDENRHGRSGMVSRSRSPAPRTPTRSHASSNTPSFVLHSPISAYSPTNFPLPI